VTMGCGDGCPYLAGLEKLDWSLSDPKGLSIETVRSIRDEIRACVTEPPQLGKVGARSPRSVFVLFCRSTAESISWSSHGPIIVTEGSKARFW